MDALIERAREHWLGRVLADGSTDRHQSEEAIGRLYRIAKLPRPQFVWVSTPIEGASESQRIVDTTDKAGLGLALGPPALERVYGWVQAGFRRTIESQLPPDQVRALDLRVRGWFATRLEQVRLYLIRRVMQEHEGGSRRVTPGQLAVMPQVWDQPSLCGYGFLDTPWIAVADVARSLGVKYSRSLERALEHVCDLTSAGWWWPYRSVAVVSERPSVIRTDDRFGLHCDSGPALVMGDVRVFAWHGLVVTPHGLDPGCPLPLGRVLRERDPDLQRFLVNRYGVERFRRDARAVPVGHDRYGTLWRIRLPDGDALQMVEVVNATPEPDGSRRRYNIRVPPNIRSPIEAVAWTFGLTAAEYRSRLRAES